MYLLAYEFLYLICHQIGMSDNLTMSHIFKRMNNGMKESQDDVRSFMAKHYSSMIPQTPCPYFDRTEGARGRAFYPRHTRSGSHT